MRLTLSNEDVRLIKHYARKREDYGNARGLKHGYGFTGDGYKVHALGIAGELAISRLYNLSWTPFSEHFWDIPADVGKDIQVRATTPSYRNLILHPKDKPEQRYVLVWVEGYTVTVAGWTEGHKAKEEGYWRELQPGRPCYLFPWQSLNPSQTLEI
jgi:hypothetical protein